MKEYRIITKGNYEYKCEAEDIKDALYGYAMHNRTVWLLNAFSMGKYEDTELSDIIKDHDKGVWKENIIMKIYLKDKCIYEKENEEK